MVEAVLDDGQKYQTSYFQYKGDTIVAAQNNIAEVDNQYPEVIENSVNEIPESTAGDDGNPNNQTTKEVTGDVFDFQESVVNDSKTESVNFATKVSRYVNPLNMENYQCKNTTVVLCVLKNIIRVVLTIISFVIIAFAVYNGYLYATSARN